MTSEEHLAQAEYYTGIFDKTWKLACENPRSFGPTTQVDIGVNDNLLRAAELHLKLAQARRADPGLAG